MGMSMRQEQSKALEQLFAAERKQAGWPQGGQGSHFVAGTYALDGGFGSGKDYGVAGHMTMCIPLLKMVSDNQAVQVGYVRITAEGKVWVPREARGVYQS